MTDAPAFVNPYWSALAETRPRLHDQVQISGHSLVAVNIDGYPAGDQVTDSRAVQCFKNGFQRTEFHGCPLQLQDKADPDTRCDHNQMPCRHELHSREREPMEALEIKILGTLGYTNPYNV